MWYDIGPSLRTLTLFVAHQYTVHAVLSLGEAHEYSVHINGFSCVKSAELYTNSEATVKASAKYGFSSSIRLMKYEDIDPRAWKRSLLSEPLPTPWS